MLILGHLGIGTKLVNPWSHGLKKKWILLGTVLPDLIDKPLYYVPVLLTGKWGREFGIISGTRTFGHTGLLLLALVFGAWFKKSRLLTALALGDMTHLLLDNWVENFSPHSPVSAHLDLFFPLYGFRFPVIPFQDAMRHLASYSDPIFIGGEIIGASFLLWDYWKYKHEKEILKNS